MNLSTPEELEESGKSRLVLIYFEGFPLKDNDIIFTDFKIEYGKNYHGEIVLGDEISPDTCRFWDLETMTFWIRIYFVKENLM